MYDDCVLEDKQIVMNHLNFNIMSNQKNKTPKQIATSISTIISKLRNERKIFWRSLDPLKTSIAEVRNKILPLKDEITIARKELNKLPDPKKSKEKIDVKVLEKRNSLLAEIAAKKAIITDILKEQNPFKEEIKRKEEGFKEEFKVLLKKLCQEHGITEKAVRRVAGWQNDDQIVQQTGDPIE